MYQSAFKTQTQRAGQIHILLRVYYGSLLALVNIYGLPNLVSVLTGKIFLTSWPIAWVPQNLLPIFGAIVILGLMFNLIITIVWPLKQSFRFGAFVLLFFYNAFVCSSGASTHLYQFWLWSSFFLGLMPSLTHLQNRAERQTLITGWLFAQNIVLLFYTLSGFWKTSGLIAQIIKGEPHLLTANGMSYHIASEIIRTGSQSLLADFFMNHTFLSPYMALAVIFIQLGCVFVIIQPRLQRLWGVLLIVFHMGTYFVLNINYPTNFLLVTVLFLCSPFGSVKFRKNYFFKSLFEQPTLTSKYFRH